MIGIGITTYKRESLLNECLEHIKKHTKTEYKLYIATDSDEERKGIALRKNECLLNLSDCEYIFLFDDDCYPIKSGWEEFVIGAHKESGYHHFCYLDDKIHNVQNHYFLRNYTLKSYKTCGGVMLFLTQHCLKTVGGFYDKYNYYGFEHIGFTFRAYLAKLSPDMFISISGLNEYIFAHDYSTDGFKSSLDLDVRSIMSDEGKLIFAEDCKEIYRPIITKK